MSYNKVANVSEATRSKADKPKANELNAMPSIDTDSANTLNIKLTRGTLQLKPQSAHSEWSLDQLMGFAERINPKRSFLFVSKVLGKHIPVKPSVMQKSYHDLAAMIPKDLPQPITVIGMAETAVCLAAGVYQALSSDYSDMVFITTTRHPLNDQPILAEFQEEHSHAMSQLLYGSNDADLQAHIFNSKTLILIDDEASTGKTFVNLVSALKQAGLRHIEQIVTTTLVNWSSLTRIDDTPTTHVALMTGMWQWQADAQQQAPDMPKVDHVAHGQYPIVAPQTFGRIPVKLPTNSWIKLRPKFTGERILVIGTCEYAWPPFLAALSLEQQGAMVKFSSTTRSPILEGLSITTKISFDDNYGLGMPNFIYNIQPEQYDRILIIAETSHQSIDPQLIALLPNSEIITYD